MLLLYGSCLFGRAIVYLKEKQRMALAQQNAPGPRTNTSKWPAFQSASLLLGFATSVILAAALVLMAGCSAKRPTVASTPSAPTSIEEPPAEPNLAQAGPAEPGKAESLPGPPPVIEPNVPMPIEPETNTNHPSMTDTNPVEPVELEPNVVLRPIAVEPNAPKLPQPEPNTHDANAVEPNEAPKKAGNDTDEPNKTDDPPKVTFHQKCAPVLNKFVDDDGMVSYRTLKLATLKLNKILDHFARLDPKQYQSWPREEKIAFWINAYNMKMLSIMVDNYPVETKRFDLLWWPPTSIKHIDKRISGIKRQKFFVMSEEFTPEMIINRFFAKEFDDPRVFFALSEATVAGPSLRNEPYTGPKLSQQLDHQARRFLTSPRGLRIDRAKKEVHLWPFLMPRVYGQQFLGKYRTDKKFKDQDRAVQAVLNFITNYVSKHDKAFLETQIRTVKYFKLREADWKLNDSSK
jgi:hypothetical protein